MLHIKETYFGTFPEFRETIPQLDQPNTGNKTFSGQVTVLESDEIKKRHAEVKAELGLDQDLNPVKTVKQEVPYDKTVLDQNYYNEISSLYYLSEL